MKIAILGYGVEGKSALRFLKKRYPNTKLEVRDEKLDRNYLKGLEKFDLIVRSPGIPYLRPEIQKAKKAGVEITSATKLFFAKANGKIIGVTGTKGKGTVATLLYRILKASGKNVFLAGNIGRPMLDILPKLKRNSITILELSSFQLQDLDTPPHQKVWCGGKSPDIAVILDISPDHLNYHKNFKEYLDAKANIAKFQKRGDKVFYFPDNKPPHQKVWCGGKYSKLIAQKGRGRKIAVLSDHNLTLKIPGFHNLKNASMAAVVSASLGVPLKIIKRTIRNFHGLPHRLEFVREVRGVRYYNDSAATNPAATVAALSAFDAPKILIAGGQSKNLSYKPLAAVIKKSNVKLVILFGKNKNEIGLACRATAEGGAVGKASPVLKTRDLKSAVALAVYRAQKGDVVILSPASTAFGEFSGYAERGEHFKKLVRTI